ETCEIFEEAFELAASIDADRPSSEARVAAHLLQQDNSFVHGWCEDGARRATGLWKYGHRFEIEETQIVVLRKKTPNGLFVRCDCELRAHTRNHEPDAIDEIFVRRCQADPMNFVRSHE